MRILLSVVVILPLVFLLWSSGVKYANKTHVSLKSHHTDHLVISCIDYRFRDAVNRWVNKNLDQADHVTIAGASKCICEPESQAFLLGQLKLAIQLHGVKTVHLVDHLDCGAYQAADPSLTPATELTAHGRCLREAKRLLFQEFPGLEVKMYILDPATHHINPIL